MLDKKSKLLFVFLLSLAFFSIAATFFKYIVLNDFYIEEDVVDEEKSVMGKTVIDFYG